MTAYPVAPPDPTRVNGRRVLAYGIDLLVTMIAIVALLYPAFMNKSVIGDADTVSCTNTTFGNTSAFEEPAPGTNLCVDLGDGRVRYLNQEDANSLSGTLYLVMFGTQALNLILLQGLTGASVGKLLVGLRVIRENGEKAGIGWAALRTLVLQVDTLCCFLPGAIMIFSTRGHRRLGDMAASTFVVDRKAMGTPPLVPGVTIGQPAGVTWTPGAGGYPPPQAGWAMPLSPDTPASPAGDGPIWDEARDTYIQYDRPRSQWVQWDAAASEWRPISQ